MLSNGSPNPNPGYCQYASVLTNLTAVCASIYHTMHTLTLTLTLNLSLNLNLTLISKFSSYLTNKRQNRGRPPNPIMVTFTVRFRVRNRVRVRFRVRVRDMVSNRVRVRVRVRFRVRNRVRWSPTVLPE